MVRICEYTKYTDGRQVLIHSTYPQPQVSFDSCAGVRMRWRAVEPCPDINVGGLLLARIRHLDPESEAVEDGEHAPEFRPCDELVIHVEVRA